MPCSVKICGVNSADALAAAVRAGADMAGFVIFPPSPRHISPEIAASLVRNLPGHMKSVVLTVDADDALIDIVRDIVRPSMIQAHGAESPARVAAISARAKLPVMKALPVAGRADLAAAEGYAPVAEMLLFDAKPPAGASRPGGFGHAFDWKIMSGYRSPRPWLLAGGLGPANVAEAIRISGATGVDVSSGVESRSGVKDAGLIGDFVAAVRGAPYATSQSRKTEEEERA